MIVLLNYIDHFGASNLHTQHAQAIGSLISVRAEPQEKGLGIKLSNTDRVVCLVMEVQVKVANNSPLVSTIQGDGKLTIYHNSSL